jgi:hypothetical protein
MSLAAAEVRDPYRAMIKKQTYFPHNLQPADMFLIGDMGLERPTAGFRQHPEWICHRHGKDWIWRQVCRQETFSLIAGESCNNRVRPTYTKWEDYIKITFALSGQYTTVLDGFGQCEHDRPQVCIMSAPRDRIKVDLLKGGVHSAVVALCLRPDFFPVHLSIAPAELPEPLRTIVLPAERPYSFHQLSCTPGLMVAARAVFGGSYRGTQGTDLRPSQGYRADVSAH